MYAQATGGGIQVVYPVQIYNARFGTSLTAAQARFNMDYLKHTSMLINLYKSRLIYQSLKFNSEGMINFTPADDIRVTMLTDFALAAQYYLQSDTFHNEFTALPHYTEMPFWQSSEYETEGSTSSIDIISSEGHAVKQDGIICLLTDIEAIGMMCDRRRLRTSPPNAKGEYVNYFQKAEIRYYNDLSENGIVFVETDTPFTAATAATLNATPSKAKKVIAE